MSSPVTFVVAVNSHEVLNSNLLASPSLQRPRGHQLIVQEGFTSAAKAYNDALDRSVNEIVVLVHQDVFLPGPWLSQLDCAVKLLAQHDPVWGVLGCWGVRQDGQGFGHVYSPGQGVIGRAFEHPVPVQTLDELVLIIRKSSGLRFDERLPGFHFYGTDICLAAASKGLMCYALSAFCVHNARQYFFYPRDFYRSYRHVKRIWKDFLPIQTSCIRISRLDKDYYSRKLKQAYWRVVSRRNPRRGNRAADPLSILEKVQSSHQT